LGKVYGFAAGRNGFCPTVLSAAATIEVCVERFPRFDKGETCQIVIKNKENFVLNDEHWATSFLFKPCLCASNFITIKKLGTAQTHKVAVTLQCALIS
jgi:hypothetical protein